MKEGERSGGSEGVWRKNDADRAAGSPVAERCGRARSPPPRAEAAVRKPSAEATPVVPRRLHAIQVTVLGPLARTRCTTSAPRQYAYGGIRVLTVPRVRPTGTSQRGTSCPPASAIAAAADAAAQPREFTRTLSVFYSASVSSSSSSSLGS